MTARDHFDAAASCMLIALLALACMGLGWAAFGPRAPVTTIGPEPVPPVVLSTCTVDGRCQGPGCARAEDRDYCRGMVAP